MSKESSQFVELVRKAAAGKISQTQRVYPPENMDCDKCEMTTLHTLIVSGEWEIYYCTECGATKQFRVR